MKNTHRVPIGYAFWIFGFMGAHRFYYGRPLSGTLYFFTFGLLGIGWLVDLFLIPAMDREADMKYSEGPYSYTLAWVFLTFLGVFGAHRFYMHRWISAIIYFLTGGVFFLGVLYDYWNLNRELDQQNRREAVLVPT